MDILSCRSKRLKFNFVNSNMVFDVGESSPDVLGAICELSPNFASVCEGLRKRIPLPPNAQPNTDGHFYRLPRHRRSYCFALSKNDALEKMYESDVITFKGGEPLLDDFSHYLRWMTKTPFRDSIRPMSEHFPIAEGKAPGAVMLKEAWREVRISLDFQTTYFKTYKKLARIPTPLFIHLFSREETNRFLDQLKGKLTSRSFENVYPHVEAGLAMVLYYYPSAPIRSDFFKKEHKPLILKHMRRLPNVEETLDRWLQLYVRMLILGYLPNSHQSIGLGSCLDKGNACIDGGFCDLDSLVEMNRVDDDGFFYDSLIASDNLLHQTIWSFLQPSMVDPSLDYLLRRYFHDAVDRLIREEVRSGRKPDRRIQEVYHPSSLESVLNCIDSRKIFKQPYTLH